MHPSFSGLFVTWAYLPQTTLPPGVTSPSSLTLTCSAQCHLTRNNAQVRRRSEVLKTAHVT